MVLFLILGPGLGPMSACLPSDCVQSDPHCGGALLLPLLYGSERTDSLIVATGQNGVVAYSLDTGITWGVRTRVPTSNPVGAIASNGRGRWVAVGGTGTGEAYFSTDAGRSWSAATIPSGIADLTEAIYTGQYFIAFGFSGAALVSVNGESWDNLTVPGFNTIRTLEKVGSTFIASGDGITMATSTDGINWTNASGPPASVLWDVSGSGNEVFGCALATYAAVSADGGNSWADATTNPAANKFGAAFLSSSMYVCGGIGGAIDTSTDGGVNWAAGPTLGTNIGDMVAVNGAALAAAAGGIVYRSTDGTTWTTQTVPDTSNLTDIVTFEERAFYLYGSIDPYAY